MQSGEAHILRTALLGKKGIAVDVGAFRGEWSRLALRHPGIGVLAVEPLAPEHAELLRLKRAFPKRIRIAASAASRENGTRNVFVPPGSGVLASLHSEVGRLDYVKSEGIRAVRVPVRTLDSLWEQHFGWDPNLHCCFIKIDVEGHECAVVKGATQLIARYRPDYVSIESNRHYVFSSCSVAEISGLLPDYTLFQVLPRGVVARDPRGDISNLHRYANFLFVAEHELSHFQEMRNRKRPVDG